MRLSTVGMIAFCAVGAVFTVGCHGHSEEPRLIPLTAADGRATATAPIGAPATVATASGAERMLDTTVATAAPVMTANPNAKPPAMPVRTVPDENRPKWVPVTGRLTVVSSQDLARNLGLPAVDPNSPEAHMTVAERLEEERLAKQKAEGQSQPQTWAWNVRTGLGRGGRAMARASR